VVGSLSMGALAEVFSERSIIFWVNVFGLALVYLFIYRNRTHVAAIYNREL